MVYSFTLNNFVQIQSFYSSMATRTVAATITAGTEIDQKRGSRETEKKCLQQLMSQKEGRLIETEMRRNGQRATRSAWSVRRGKVCYCTAVVRSVVVRSVTITNSWSCCSSALSCQQQLDWPTADHRNIKYYSLQGQLNEVITTMRAKLQALFC